MILEIYDALQSLKDAYPEITEAEVKKYLRDIEPLTDAAQRGEWKLIAEAVELHRWEDDTKLAKIFVRRLAAQIAHQPQKFGLAPTPSKGDILEILEIRYEPLYQLIPKSNKGLSEWWKMVDCNAQQSRGYPDPNRLVRFRTAT